MKNLLTILMSLAGSSVISAYAALEVVATTPDLGAIAQAVGGDKVHVTSLARGTEDPHFVDAKPSFARVLNKADVLIEGGAELEIGWLPPLVDNARNRKIVRGAEGRIDASEGILLLEVPQKLDRSEGDVHAVGNPHYSLNPQNGKIIAQHLAEKLAKLDPANAAAYAQNSKAFVAALDAKVAEWTALLKPVQGVKVVAYHKSFEYFAQSFGLNVVGYIEPKPGIEPSPTHINALVPKMKAEGVKLIIMEPNRPRKTPDYVANAIGAKVVLLPLLVGGNPEATDYLKLIDYDVKAVVQALK